MNGLELLDGVTPLVVAVPLLMAMTRRKGTLYVTRIQQMIPTTFAYCSLVVVGGLFEAANSLDGSLPIVPLGVGVIGMALVVWGQWFINDVYDKETDKYSNPDRPTTMGAISDREALRIGTVLVLGGVVATSFNGLYAFASLFGYVVVNTIYSIPPFRTKAGGLSSMITLGTMGGFGILLGSATIVSSPTSLAMKLAVIVLVFMAINMSYKDLKDAEHDARSGVTNFTVQYGADTVTRVLLVILPVSYLVVALYFGLYRSSVIFVFFGAYVAYLLYTWKGENEIVYKLDAVNGIYLLTLAVLYYTFG